MEEGLGPCVVAAVGELSQEEAGELKPYIHNGVLHESLVNAWGKSDV